MGYPHGLQKYLGFTSCKNAMGFPELHRIFLGKLAYVCLCVGACGVRQPRAGGTRRPLWGGPSFGARDMGISQKLGVPFWGVYNKDYSILGSILGSPDFGKLPYLWVV